MRPHRDRKMKIFILACLCVYLCRSQNVNGYDYNDYDNGIQQSQTPDPRQNRAPIQFPMAPLTGVGLSGVRAGASGFGFYPPKNGLNQYNYY